jgi:hypothetical protein
MRRLAALAGLVMLMVLIVALFWRVYRHHEAVDPYAREQPTMVEGRSLPQGSAETPADFAMDLR